MLFRVYQPSPQYSTARQVHFASIQALENFKNFLDDEFTKRSDDFSDYEVRFYYRYLKKKLNNYQLLIQKLSELITNLGSSHPDFNRLSGMLDHYLDNERDVLKEQKEWHADHKQLRREILALLNARRNLKKQIDFQKNDELFLNGFDIRDLFLNEDQALQVVAYSVKELFFPISSVFFFIRFLLLLLFIFKALFAKKKYCRTLPVLMIGP